MLSIKQHASAGLQADVFEGLKKAGKLQPGQTAKSVCLFLKHPSKPEYLVTHFDFIVCRHAEAGRYIDIGEYR